MESNILNAGVAELTALRERITKLEQEKTHNEEILKQIASLQKEADKKRKAMNDEIETTLKKRKDAIEENFDGQIAALNKELKKIRADRQKEKENLVSDKVVAETADLREEVKAIKHDIKVLIGEKKLPFVTKYWAFYALFMPKSAMEIVFSIIFFILAFMLLPVGVSTLLDGALFGETWTPAIIYMLDILLFGGAYMLINNLVKDKNRDELKAISEMRVRIRLKNREIKLVKRGIEKDTDESAYNLEAFDTEIHNKEDGVRRLETERKGALNDYNSNIRPALIEEIQGRLQPDIDALKKQIDELQNEQRKLADFLKEETIELTKNYEPYLGRSNMNEASLLKMESFINEGKSGNVGEALALLSDDGKQADKAVANDKSE